jgi:broad specificity phosphatase PhoE
MFTGQYLKNFGPFDAVYTSPMLRAKETARVIAHELKLNNNNQFIIDNRLIECKSGIMSGKTKSEREEFIKKNPNINKLFMKYMNANTPLERAIVEKKYGNKFNNAIKAETTKSVQDRMINFLGEIVESKSNLKKIIIVSHSGTITDFISGIFRIPQVPLGPMYKEKSNCSICLIEYVYDKTIPLICRFKMVAEPSNIHLELFNK